MSDTNELVERLTGFANGTFHYKAYRGKAPDGVPQLRSDILALVAALAPVEAVPVAWRDAAVSPEIPKGTERNFIVAVRRARNGKVYSFPAAYLNAYPLRFEYECPKGDGCEGNGCEDGCPTTGWYSATGDGDDGLTYEALYLEKDDEFLGWREVPQWEAALAHPPAQAGAVTEAMVEAAAQKLQPQDWGSMEPWEQAVARSRAEAALTAALGAQTPPEWAVMAERERIAQALEDEADTTPCAEDAMVVRDCALLVRANFSYDEAERLSTPPVNQSEGR